MARRASSSPARARSPAARSPAPPKAAKKAPIFLPVRSVVPVFTFIGGSTAALVWWHHDVHHTLNAVQASIALFCAVNVFVALSEMTLYFHSDDIRRDWKRNEAKLGVGKLPPVYLFQKVPLAELFTSYHWSQMWSTYAALDPSYADSTSFGFCVDTGNGFTTLLPSVAFALGMTHPLLPPRWLGMLGLVKFYQELYGTVMYFFQYFFNRRYERAPPAMMWAVVIPCNMFWIVLPALGIWASGRMILDDDFAAFGQQS